MTSYPQPIPSRQHRHSEPSIYPTSPYGIAPQYGSPPQYGTSPQQYRRSISTANSHPRRMSSYEPPMPGPPPVVQHQQLTDLQREEGNYFPPVQPLLSSTYPPPNQYPPPLQNAPQPQPYPAQWYNPPPYAQPLPSPYQQPQPAPAAMQYQQPQPYPAYPSDRQRHHRGESYTSQMSHRSHGSHEHRSSHDYDADYDRRRGSYEDHRRPSYDPRRISYDGDYDADEHDRDGEGRRHSLGERRHHRKHHHEEEKHPTIGDSMLWAWDKVIDTLAGKKV